MRFPMLQRTACVFTFLSLFPLCTSNPAVASPLQDIVADETGSHEFEAHGWLTDHPVADSALPSVIRLSEPVMDDAEIDDAEISVEELVRIGHPDEILPFRPILTREQQTRKDLLSKCLAIYYTRQVDADVLRPWSIMHGLIGYGEDTLIVFRGKRYDAIDYLCANGIGDDRRILFARNGKLQTKVGPGVQGHEAQLLAMLAQADVPADQSMTVDGQKFTVQDLIEKEMADCKSGTELTFRLLSLSHYLKSDATWKDRRGEEWSMTRLMKEELAEPVNEGACGGTHRLMAISYALKKRREQGLPIEGVWKSADKFIREFQEYTWKFQARDGSFSTGWYKERKFSGDAERKLYTTGHILEWLVFSLPEEDLDDPRISRSVDFILNLMLGAPNYDLAVGPRGHAIHALRMYEDKMFETSNYARFMNNRKIVSNNPQNGGGNSNTQTGPSGLFSPAGFRGPFGGRR